MNDLSSSSIGNHQSPEIQSLFAKLCEYGCGNEAKFQLSNAKWCCSNSNQRCPAIKKKNSDKAKENHKIGKIHSFIIKREHFICPLCNKHMNTTKANITIHLKNCKKLNSIIIKICPLCKKEFEVDYAHKGRIYCSKSCANRISTKSNKNKKKIVNCKYCNKDIKVGITSMNNNHTCVECFTKYYTKPKRIFKEKTTSITKPKVTTKQIKCMYCGKDLTVTLNLYKSRYRCHECKMEYYKKNNYVVTDKGSIYKKKICKICGVYDHLKPEICKKKALILALIKYCGFDKNKLGTIEVYNEFERIKKMLEYDYYENKMCLGDIAKKYNHNVGSNFGKIMYSLGIKLRNFSESLINYVETSPNYIVPHCNKTHFKHGWHTTWNGKQVYFRSNNELVYAKELDERKINYDMEKLRIKYFDSIDNKMRNAIPDFYIPSTNTIVEIKGSYLLSIQNMKDKVKAYKEKGYNFKFILDFKEVDLNSL